MKTYQEANEVLTGRNAQRKKLENNTYLERRTNGNIAVKLHATDIVLYHADGSATLDSGGWRTVTTKDRINRYAPVGISQSSGQWYVGKWNDKAREWEELGLFTDGMKVNADGSLEGVEPISKVRENLKLRRRVQRYAARFLKAMEQGKVLAPGDGDCWHCLMREVKSNAPLGEAMHDTDHLLSHVDENYFVPSLLARAFEVMPHSQVMGWAIAEKWNPEAKAQVKEGHVWWSDYTRCALQKMLARYMLRQLGQAA